MASSPKKTKIQDECSFGLFLKEQCHQKTAVEIQPSQDLSDKEQKVYLWRAGVETPTSITSICKFHLNFFGDVHYKKNSKCCDPYVLHKKLKKPIGTHSISLAWAEKLKSTKIDGLEMAIVPGWKVCKNCHMKVKDDLDRVVTSITVNDEDDDEEFSPDVDECDNVLESTMFVNEQRDELNSYWESMGISPLKTHSLSKSSKVKDASEKINRSQEKQKELAKELFGLPDTSQLEKNDIHEIDKEIESKAKNFDRLMLLMKEKLKENTLPTCKRIQLLTMAPLDWSRKRVATFFEVSEYQVREARKLAEEKGILALPDPKRGRSLSKEVEDSVKLFYEDDEYSRQMPGTKDYVSIARNVHKQKRLLLCNLKELYQAYKEKFPQHKIGLSKFCQLRPKWCVTVTSAGTHSVCVCTNHQNPKLMVDAFCNVINRSIKSRERAYIKEHAEREENSNDQEDFPLYNITYKDLLQLVVCDTENMECMVHRCDSCPTFTALKEYLEKKLEEYEVTEDITFSQWDSTDRTTLVTHVAPVDEFVDLLVYAIDNLSTHSFVARSQARYLKARKEQLDRSTCIILLDFAENYHYLVQDEVQGFHWNKDQCTLHPVVIYYKNENNELVHRSLCIISDDLDHDTNFVNKLQELVCHYIKNEMPEITSIEYWSDGCAGQYKNYKNMMNLCLHNEDFGLKASWYFFATSHGKSPCDGIGGTVKRKIARTSLQRPVSDQILTFAAVEKFCSESFPSITFFSIYKNEMVPVRERLDKRYLNGDTISGTRSCHQFEPIASNVIRAKQLSDDKTYLIDNHHFSAMPTAAEIGLTVKINDYATVLFHGYWWLVLVTEIDMEQKDVECKFLQNASSGQILRSIPYPLNVPQNFSNMHKLLSYMQGTISEVCT